MVIVKRTALFLFCGMITFSVLTACDGSETQPDNLIQEDAYIDLLVELQLIKLHHNALPDSVNADSLKKLIYEKYDVNEEQFVSSHQYYQQQVREQLQRTDEAVLRLQQEEERLRAQYDSLRADTAITDTSKVDTTLTDTTLTDTTLTDTTGT